MWLFKRFYGLIIITLFTILIIVLIKIFVYTRISEKTALIVCGNLIYTYIDKNFTTTKVIFTSYYKINESRIELFISYPNGAKTTSDCIFSARYTNNIVNLKQALLVNEKGKLIIIDNLKLKY